MKRRLSALTVPLFFSLGCFAVARSAASWRPKIIGVHAGAYDFQVSPDSRWLLSTSQGAGDLVYPQQSRRLFDTSGKVAARSFEAEFAKFSDDGRALLVFDQKRGQLQLMNTETGAIKARWTNLTAQPYESIGDARLQKGGRELVAVTPFRIWRLDVKSGRKLSQTKIQIRNREAAGCGLMGGETLFKDGKRLLYLNADEAWIYDARTGKRRGKAEMGFLAPDEKWQWFYNAEVGAFWLMDSASGVTLWESETVGAAQFAGDGKTLIAIDAASGVHLLDPRTGKSIEKLKVPMPQADARGTNETFALSPDNNFWFVRQNDKIMRMRMR